MDANWCLHCESLITHVFGGAYCSQQCFKDDLGETAKVETLRSSSPFSLRGGSSGHQSSDSYSGDRRRSSATGFDYSTSEADYESTNPTTTDGADSLDEDFKFPQLLPKGRCFPLVGSRRASPLIPSAALKPVTESTSLPNQQATSASPSHLIPPARPRVNPLSNSLGHPNGATLDLGPRPASDPIIPPRGSHIRKSRKNSRTALAVPVASTSAMKRKHRPALSPRSSTKQLTGFFLADGQHDDEVGSDADSECEHGQEVGSVMNSRLALNGLKRIASGNKVSGQQTPTSSQSAARSKGVWSIAELCLDDFAGQEADGEEGIEEQTFGRGPPESSDSEVDDRRGRQRGIARRISLGSES